MEVSEQRITCNSTTKGLYLNAWGRFLCDNNTWIYEGMGFFNDGFLDGRYYWVKSNPYHDYVKVKLEGGELVYQTYGDVNAQNPDYNAVYK